jgi:hypothetical protein
MYDFVDPSLRKEKSHQYSLSIQASLDGFSFCIRGESSELLCFKYIPVKISNEQLFARRLEDWFDEEEMLQLPYRKKQVLFAGPNFTLLPRELESDEVKTYVSNLMLKADDETERSENWIEALQAKLLFSLPPRFLALLNDKFGDFKVVHVLSDVIERLFAYPSETAMMLFFVEKEMYLLMKKYGKLVLCNVFRINHPNDAIYYVISAGKQFQLNNKQTTVLLAGRSMYFEQLKVLLSKHFSKLQIVKGANPIQDLDEYIVPGFVCLW